MEWGCKIGMENMAEEVVYPLTVLVPEATSQPIDIVEGHAALRLAVVERAGLGSLGSDWDKPGLYVLLDRPESDGRWGCYVGKAPAGVRARLKNHGHNKDHWYRALLIRRDTGFGFHSGQVGWLEGRLYDAMAASPKVQLHNKNQPGDQTLQPHDLVVLEACVPPIMRVLRLLGHDPLVSGPHEKSKTTAPTAATKKKQHWATIKHLIDAGLLTPGTELVSTNGVWPATAVVTGDGHVEYDGTPYAHPSSASKRVANGISSNGWDFWAIKTQSGLIKLSALRDEFEASGRSH
jgi:hypothetical protein